MIFARYRVDKKAKVLVVELLNQDKTKRGFTNVEAVYHLENAIRKHCHTLTLVESGECEAISIRIVDAGGAKNTYLETIKNLFERFASGRGYRIVQ